MKKKYKMIILNGLATEYQAKKEALERVKTRIGAAEHEDYKRQLEKLAEEMVDVILKEEE